MKSGIRSQLIRDGGWCLPQHSPLWGRGTGQDRSPLKLLELGGDFCSHTVTLSGHKGFNPSFQQSPWMKATFEGFSCVSRASLVACITPSLGMSRRSTQTRCPQWQARRWHSVFAQWVLGVALCPHRLFFHSLSCQYPQHSHV